MLLTQLSTIIASLAAVAVAFYCVARQFRVEKAVFAALETLATQNKRSLSLARMAEVEATLTELLDSYNALLQSHRKLRARIGMRKVREKLPTVPVNGEAPQGEAEKAAFKAQLRAQLIADGRLKP